MLSDYKLGDIDANRNQSSLIEVLIEDLLPDEVYDIGNEEQLLSRLAAEDSRWNNAAQEVIAQLYDLKEQDKLEEVKYLKNNFKSACPSTWYKSIVMSIQ